MKRLMQLLFFMVATHSVAQDNFYNTYLITVSGTMTPDNDPNVGDCNSGFYLNAIFENNEQLALTPYNQVGGRGNHAFLGRREFSSSNKVRSIFVHGKNENYELFDGCEGQEGDIILPLSLTGDYPCVERTINYRIARYSGVVTVNIQPLRNKLTTTLRLFNNGVQKISINYSAVATTPGGQTYNLFSGSSGRYRANALISQTDNIDLVRKEIASINLSTSARRQVGRLTQTIPTSHNFTISNPASFSDTIFTFRLYNDATNQSTLDVRYEEVKFPIRYGPVPYESLILPSDPDNRITLLGPSGNQPSLYHWVYSTDGNVWNDLPAQYQGQERIQVCGNDLMSSSAFRNYHGRNLFFKILVDCNGGESQILTLTGKISAPNIASFTPLPARCSTFDLDGAFEIIFDRPLLNDGVNVEQLNILVTDLASPANTIDQINNVVLDSDNRLQWPRRLASVGQYRIQFIGAYLGFTTYTDHPTNHSRTFTLQKPLPVTSVITPSPVHCHNGGDGAITLEASGGVGNYNFQFLPEGELNAVDITFGSSTNYTINFLRYGNYAVTVRDGNNCVDAAGTKTILVTQPDEALHIGFSNVTDPRAYHYKDGYIETVLVGGTPLNDGSYIVEWYDPINLLHDSLYNNAPLSQGYQANIDSLGDGSYILRAYDSQYTLAHPDHREGCFIVSDTFKLTEPPPLVVAIRETHYVSCFGYDDGELTAHADGGIKIQTGLPYQYEWLTDDNGTVRPINQSDSIASQLRSGVYLIRITDRNRIQKLSTPFTLIQPNVLQASMVTTPVSCSSGTDGTARVTVTGGTLPYVFEWSDETSDPYNTDLIEGRYFVFAIDSRNCTTSTSGNVLSPNPLQVDSLLHDPQCFGYSNGSININVQEGTSPYQYQWSTGATTKDIDGLSEGEYTVLIVDRNNCRNYRRYELKNPDPIRIELGGERYLCNDQTYTANASIQDPGTLYQWRGPNNFSASTSQIVIADEGVYHVDVTDSKGCNGQDDLSIKRVNIEIGSEFIVTTQAFQGEAVTMINISNPSPDSVKWWSSNSSVDFVTELYNRAELVFSEPGSYVVYLRAYRQGCEKDFAKTVIVVPSTFENEVTEEKPFLENFSVSPNPTNGPFRVSVSLREEVPIRLRLISIANNTVINDYQERGKNDYTLTYEISPAANTYLLLLETPKGSYVLKVVIY